MSEFRYTPLKWDKWVLIFLIRSSRFNTGNTDGLVTLLETLYLMRSSIVS